MKNTDSFSVNELFGDLPVLKVRIVVKTAENAALPPYTGSAWRGLMGWEVQGMVCPFDRRPVCNECAVREHCPYFLLVEKKTPVSGLLESPRGYIISPRFLENRENQEIRITLIGNCSRFLPVAVQAFFNGEKTGIGRGNHPFRVISLSETIPDKSERELPVEGSPPVRGPFPLRDWIGDAGKSPERLSFRLLTPVRLRQKGKYMGQMDWAFYFSTLVRRLEALHCLFSHGEPLGRERWLGIQQQFAFNGNVRERLQWEELERYSGRQKRKMPMGGLVGEAEIRSPSPELRQWLRAAEVLHVGKNASMGLGRVELF